MKKASVWIAKRQGKKGTTYHVQYIVGGRVKTESAGRDSAMAKAVASRVRAQLNEGTYKATTPITWDDFIKKHIDGMQGRRQGTIEAVKLAVGHLQRICSPQTPLQIDRAMLKAYRAQRLNEGARPATINKELRGIRSVLSEAVKDGYIKQNPLIGDKSLFLAEPEIKVNAIDGEAFKKLLAVCNCRYTEAACLLAYYGGLRLGEIMALEWSDLDLKSNLIRVSNRDNHATKSGKEREIPMSPQIKAALESLQIGRLKNTLIFRPIFEEGIQGDRPEITPRVVGGLSKRIRRTVQRAGFVDDKGRPLFSGHDLRRSFGTSLASRGIDPKTIMELLGHSRVEVTFKYYVHSSLPAKRLAIAMISETA